jgi:hypothetical protein
MENKSESESESSPSGRQVAMKLMINIIITLHHLLWNEQEE